MIAHTTRFSLLWHHYGTYVGIVARTRSVASSGRSTAGGGKDVSACLLRGLVLVQDFLRYAVLGRAFVLP